MQVALDLSVGDIQAGIKKLHVSQDQSGTQLNIIGMKDLEIVVARDGHTLWVNCAGNCLLRIGFITGEILIDDARPKNSS